MPESSFLFLSIMFPLQSITILEVAIFKDDTSLSSFQLDNSLHALFITLTAGVNFMNGERDNFLDMKKLKRLRGT
jgi:hypothetical protein